MVAGGNYFGEALARFNVNYGRCQVLASRDVLNAINVVRRHLSKLSKERNGNPEMEAFKAMREEWLAATSQMREAMRKELGLE